MRAFITKKNIRELSLELLLRYKKKGNFICVFPNIYILKIWVKLLLFNHGNNRFLKFRRNLIELYWVILKLKIISCKESIIIS